MLDFLSKFKELKNLNNIISSEVIVVEKDGVKVKINGKFEIEEIILNPNLDFSKNQKVLKDCLNEAFKKLQFNLFNKLSFLK